ncbi:MAG: hypothetical protein JO123_04415, partial [Ktedonobacteraceae bacterium]|nr:hypothetical protein [Ktedonobacteraceae bacterium]
GGQQQDQYGQGQGGQQQDQYGQGQNPQQQQHGSLHQPREMAEQQIDQAIDQFGNKIPGGSQYTQQAKEAASGILDNLENQVEKKAGDMLGGMFGGNQ